MPLKGFTALVPQAQEMLCGYISRRYSRAIRKLSDLVKPGNETKNGGPEAESAARVILHPSRQRVKLLLTRGMAAIAGDLDLVRSCVLAELTAVFLIRRDHALARRMRAFSAFRTHRFSFSLMKIGDGCTWMPRTPWGWIQTALPLFPREHARDPVG